MRICAGVKGATIALGEARALSLELALEIGPETTIGLWMVTPEGAGPAAIIALKGIKTLNKMVRQMNNEPIIPDLRDNFLIILLRIIVVFIIIHGLDKPELIRSIIYIVD